MQGSDQQPAWAAAVTAACPPETAVLLDGAATRALAPAIILDFDSTLFPLLDAIALLPGLGHVSYEATPDWGHLVDACGGMQEMLDAFTQVMTLRAMRQVGLFPFAAAGVGALAAAGWHALVVTDRDPGRAEATRTMLVEHGVPHLGLVCGPVDKVAVASAAGARLVIDDKPDTLAAADQAGLAATTLAWPYNRQVCRTRGLPAAAHWPQLTMIAQQLLGHGPGSS